MGDIMSIQNEDDDLRGPNDIYNEEEDTRITTSARHLLSYIEETKMKDLSHFKTLKVIKNCVPLCHISFLRKKE